MKWKIFLPDLNRLDTDTRYMGIKLGIDESANYKLDAKLSYGGLKYNEDKFRNQKRIIENNSSEISGTIGDDDSICLKV